jgi:hypothetical protein
MEVVVNGFELAGVAILVVGSLLAFGSAGPPSAVATAELRTSAPDRTSAGRSSWDWRS